MIRYALKCGKGHVFEAWFRDSAAFDALAAQRRLACSVCDDARVEKTLMAPSLRGEERAADAAGERHRRADTGATDARPSDGGVRDGSPPGGPAVDGPAKGGPQGDLPARPGPLSGPAAPVEQALARLRQYLSDKADYVGRRFADEARRIHGGEAEERAIWGEATPEDARALQEEGVPVAPLPPLSRRDD